MKRFEKALKMCSAVLQLDENNGEAFANRGDAYLSMDEFEKAKHDFKSAHDTDSQNQRVQCPVRLTLICSTWRDSERQRPC